MATGTEAGAWLETGLQARRLRLDGATAPGGVKTSWLPRAALAVVLVGLAWRLLRYAVCFPIYGDEALLCFNLMRGWQEILQPLEYGQIAPLPFVLGEWGCYHLLGSSEYSLRLLPLLASVLSLPLFWMLARTVLSREAAWLATAILSVSTWPVAMGSLIKPYSGDLFWALTLLVPAARILKKQERAGGFWWAWLLIAAPLAIVSSFTSAFVGGAVGLALLPLVWRSRSPRVWLAFAGFGVLLLGAFAWNYSQVMARTPSDIRGYMDWYWRTGFPPADVAGFFFWLLKAHVGQAFAYPIGAANGGSTLTFLLVLLGVIALWRGERRYLPLIALPFALSFSASCTRNYPYGDSCRLAQHLAPSICLLAGAGIVFALRSARPETRQRTLLFACSFFALIGLIGVGKDLLRPYRTAGDLWHRQNVAELFRHVSAEDRVYHSLPLEHLDITLRWYLFNQDVKPVAWTSADLAALPSGNGRVWLLDMDHVFDLTWRPHEERKGLRELTEALADSSLERQAPWHFLRFGKGAIGLEIQYVGIHVWTRDGQRPLLSAGAFAP